ncbi:MAG: hypothetical protein ACLR43_00075 [Faecalibacillus faecis]
MAAGKTIPHVLNIGLWDLANLGIRCNNWTRYSMFFKVKSNQY